MPSSVDALRAKHVPRKHPTRLGAQLQAVMYVLAHRAGVRVDASSARGAMVVRRALESRATRLENDIGGLRLAVAVVLQRPASSMAVPLLRPSDFAFNLPSALIAQAPAVARDAARLLDVTGGAMADSSVSELATRLPPKAVVVVNDTKVLPARVFGQKDTGGAVELLFLEPAQRPAERSTAAPFVWRCLARARRALHVGQRIAVNGVQLSVESERDNDGTLLIGVPCEVLGFLEQHGRLPLPPYIERAREAPQPESDRERYQTVFASAPGAVAAPTAGLHMTNGVLAELARAGHTLARVTLHVGWGTFSPIRSDTVAEHHMHRERYEIPAETAALVASGRPIVAVGTTTLRALEAAALPRMATSARENRQVQIGPSATDIFVYPGSGHRFAVVDYLLTNFHLPESTLLMLVAAFAGTSTVAAAYRHAIAAAYRFYSYGDAMLLRCDPAGAMAASPTFASLFTEGAL